MEGETQMNELTLKHYNENEIEYFYQPEGKGIKGVIKFDVKTGKATITKHAESDCGKDYDFMAKIAVEEISRRNNLPRKYTQMWY